MKMSMTNGLVTRDDVDMIVVFAGCSLDDSPGSNWVSDAGGLPTYICQIARAVKKSGKSTSQAIAIAVSRVKKWATGTGVDKKTQAKAAAAVAEWEKLKGKNKGKKAAKKSQQALAASNTDADILCLTDYNVDIVRSAFDQRSRDARAAWRKANPNASYDDPGYPQYLWVKEQWTAFLIVQSDYGKNPDLYKIPYSVDDDLNVTFGDAVEVKTEYVEVNDADTDDDKLTDDVLQKIMAATGPCPARVSDKFLTLTPPPTRNREALEKVLALAAKNRINTGS